MLRELISVIQILAGLLMLFSYLRAIDSGEGAPSGIGRVQEKKVRQKPSASGSSIDLDKTATGHLSDFLQQEG